MSPVLRVAAALYADAAVHEEIAEQFRGTGEPYFEQLVAGHERSAQLAYRQADALIRANRPTTHQRTA